MDSIFYMKRFSQWTSHIISQHAAGLFCALLMMVLYHKWSPNIVSAVPFVYNVVVVGFQAVYDEVLICDRHCFTAQYHVCVFDVTIVKMKPTSHSVSVMPFSKTNLMPVLTSTFLQRKRSLCPCESSIGHANVACVCSWIWHEMLLLQKACHVANADQSTFFKQFCKHLSWKAQLVLEAMSSYLSRSAKWWAAIIVKEISFWLVPYI